MSPSLPSAGGDAQACSTKSAAREQAPGRPSVFRGPAPASPGSSRASSDTPTRLLPASFRWQSAVARRGWCRCDRASPGELRLTVRTASPAIRARSSFPEQRQVARGVAGRGNDLPVRQAGGTCLARVDRARPGLPQGGHPVPLDTGQGADDAARGGQWQFVGMRVHGDVPPAGQFRSRASVVRVHVRQHDRRGLAQAPDEGLRRAADQPGPAPPHGVDQNPGSARLHEVDVRVSPFPGDQAVDPGGDGFLERGAVQVPVHVELTAPSQSIRDASISTTSRPVSVASSIG